MTEILEKDVRTERIKTIYNSMIGRCKYESSPNYDRYGGRGITVCDQWLNDRSSFISWALNNGYCDGLTIDRIDNDGNYEPDNCRWATYSQQARNTSRTRYIEFNGEKTALLDVAEAIGISHEVLSQKMEENEMEELNISSIGIRVVQMAARSRSNTRKFKVMELKKIIDEHFVFFEMKR